MSHFSWEKSKENLLNIFLFNLRMEGDGMTKSMDISRLMKSCEKYEVNFVKVITFFDYTWAIGRISE